MSHPVNDVILERLYLCLLKKSKKNFLNEHPAFIVHEVQKRFEDLSQ